MSRPSNPVEHRRPREFRRINHGFDRVFRTGRMSLGLVVPIEAYPQGPVPTMAQHLERVRRAEQLGFSAVWLRDVPFNVASFGDAGQIFDPFVYLGFLAGQTERIALGVASIVLPLRHPAHVAKAAASADQLSGGRLILGVASGDRPQEYPALALPFEDRGERFRASFDYIRSMARTEGRFENPYGRIDPGVDLLPKPSAGRLPLLVTGGSRQHPDWSAQHADGWMIYPRAVALQARVVGDWRARVEAAGSPPKPIMQPLYVDLTEDPGHPPQPIHLGLRLGSNHLRDHLRSLAAAGIDHVALNLRFNRADIEGTLERLAADILPEFSG
ncbi:MAG: LLM class oxidoreductase [Acidobacteriota bacterium]